MKINPLLIVGGLLLGAAVLSKNESLPTPAELLAQVRDVGTTATINLSQYSPTVGAKLAAGLPGYTTDVETYPWGVRTYYQPIDVQLSDGTWLKGAQPYHVDYSDSTGQSVRY